MKREISVRKYQVSHRQMDYALSAPSYRSYDPVPGHLGSEVEPNMRRG